MDDNLNIPDTVGGGSAEEPVLELIAEGNASLEQEISQDEVDALLAGLPLEGGLTPSGQPAEAVAASEAASVPGAAPEAVSGAEQAAGAEAAPSKPVKEKKTRGLLKNVFGYELTLVRKSKPEKKSAAKSKDDIVDPSQKAERYAPMRPRRPKLSKEEKEKQEKEKKEKQEKEKAARKAKQEALAKERAAKKAEQAKLSKEKKAKKDAQSKAKKAEKDKKKAAGKGGAESGDAEGGKRRPSKKLILMIAGAIVVTGCGTGVFMFLHVSNTPEALIAKARQFDADKNFGKSVEIYDKVIKTGELLPEAYMGIARALVSSDDLPSALEKLNAGFEQTGDYRLSRMIDELTPKPEGSGGTSISQEDGFSAPSGEPIVWKDSALERMVRLALNIPDAPITEKDLEGITSLKILGNTHASIEEAGLHSQNGLNSYTIGGETFSDRGEIYRLDDMAHFKSLNRLVIGYNSIRDISGLEGMNFSTLSLYANEITDLSPLEGMKGLRYLYLYNNLIEDISPLKGNSELISLSLQHNQIRDISPLSSLSKLEELYISSNLVEDISPLEGLENLTFLNAQENSISDIKAVALLPGLTDVSFLGNPVLDYSPAAHVQNLNKSFGPARG